MNKSLVPKIEDPDLQNLLSIMYSFGVITRYIENELRKHASRPIRAIVLNTLHSYGGSMTPMQLSRELQKAPNSITSLINNLEKDSLVEKQPNKKDARSVKIALTDKGIELANELMPVMREIGIKALSVLTEKQIKGLRTYLRLVRHHLLEQLEQDAESEIPLD
jgi:DNA-binding MarR family transcriptional regulator